MRSGNVRSHARSVLQICHHTCGRILSFCVPSMVTRVFLGNLKFEVTQKDIVKAISDFVPYAWIEFVQISRKGRLNDRKPCCAFVSLGSDSEATEVINHLNGVRARALSGGCVRAEKAVPRMVEMAPKQEAATSCLRELYIAFHVDMLKFLA